MKTKRSGMLATLGRWAGLLLCLAAILVGPDAWAAEEESAAPHSLQPLALPAGWQTYESAEGRFRVYMPSKPELTVGKRSTIVGSLDENHYEAVRGEAFYLVEVRDLPRVASWLMTDAGLLDRSAESLIDHSRAENIQEERITQNGYPGIDLSFDAGNHSGFFERARILLVNRRLYVVITGAPASAPDTYMKTFIDSFEFWES